MADVTITRPATVQKNPDGTYSVRIQHDDVAGTYTEVHFPNVVFAETLANGYAAFLNGLTKLENVAKEVGPDLRADAEKVLAAARKEAALLESKAETEYDKIVKSAKAEAAALRADAENFLAKTKAEAGKLLAEAKAEIEKLKVTKTTTTPSPATTAPAAPATTSTSEIEEV